MSTKKYEVRYMDTDGNLAKFPYDDWDSAFEHYMAANAILEKHFLVFIIDTETGERHELS